MNLGREEAEKKPQQPINKWENLQKIRKKS